MDLLLYLVVTDDRWPDIDEKDIGGSTKKLKFQLKRILETAGDTAHASVLASSNRVAVLWIIGRHLIFMEQRLSHCFDRGIGYTTAIGAPVEPVAY